jgi:hypothetical protein
MTWLAQRGSTRQGKKSQKVGTFFHNRPICRFIFENQWGLFGGDLKEFDQPFVKVILKKLTSTHGRPTFSKSPWIGAAQICSFDSCATELSSE